MTKATGPNLDPVTSTLDAALSSVAPSSPRPTKGDLARAASDTSVMDRAWIAGVSGAIAVFVCAAWFSATDALQRGVFLGSWQVTSNRLDTVLAALVLVSATMVAVELVRLWRRSEGTFVQLSPAIRQRRYLRLFAASVVEYVKYLCLWWLAMQFFWWANEYGYQRGANFYRGWFRLIELAWVAFLWLGLPYILLTRAFKHDADADRRDFTTLFSRTLLYLASWVPLWRDWRRDFTEEDRKAARALLVKLFFAPLMTVFFIDQFPHLVNNMGYLFSGLPTALAEGQYSHARFNSDFFNISVAAIFSVDVALAWCGYMVSSRWVDNHTRSAEPTMLGWVVCLVCYPPFQMFLGLYFSAPNERDLLAFSNQWLVTLFTLLMLLSYFVYMCATMWFGVRFSNLTHRGIIRTGPYALVRHPAYAAKNFAWWCLMFPVILWNSSHAGLPVAVLQTLGLVLMTWIYYLRALTEERHLSMDPAYRDYCRAVPYRFIPGVF